MSKYSIETFYGIVETTKDAFIIFESCLSGTLPLVNRRLSSGERNRIRSGSIFVFDRNTSNIKRWTDGILWSTSRVEGNFLVYSEVEKVHQWPRSGNTAIEPEQGRLITSYRGTFRPKESGLMKKTMSLDVRGRSLHLVSYYTELDARQKRLPLLQHNAALSPVSLTLADEVRMERALVGKHRAQEATVIKQAPPEQLSIKSMDNIKMEHRVVGRQQAQEAPIIRLPAPGLKSTQAPETSIELPRLEPILQAREASMIKLPGIKSIEAEFFKPVPKLNFSDYMRWPNAAHRPSANSSNGLLILSDLSSIIPKSFNTS